MAEPVSAVPVDGRPLKDTPEIGSTRPYRRIVGAWPRNCHGTPMLCQLAPKQSLFHHSPIFYNYSLENWTPLKKNENDFSEKLKIVEFING